MMKFLLPALLVLYSGSACAQQKFDAPEYHDILFLNFKAIGDTAHQQYSLLKGSYRRLMRSPEVGLHNVCEFYIRDSTAILSLRGTINKTESWLENFYAAMVCANGSLQLNDSTRFNYQLARDSTAYVHVGWLVGLGFLSPYIREGMDSLLQAGIRHVVIAGHSQGGALAFLTTSYVYYLYHEKYPDLQLTTYASAPPKPGNMYYTYDLDFISHGNTFRVVNTADWVPETPFSIQTLDDYRLPNPFSNPKPTIRKQKFLVRLALNHIYNKMKNGSATAMKRYRKYLGSMIYKQVKKAQPQLQEPEYRYSVNYSTAGVPIILPADSAYHKNFVFNGRNVFIHHGYNAYQYLLKEYFLSNATNR
ncbi:lipase family protein [Deminuibacter soli]|uniref:Lipase family protein n=1 Tax=Deminuibacter soli TaxID=2291815 RepID=A0A3E1NQM4_9BACT|nr:lipase family protein [Deminuibacter soli]RFM30210.1 lipase family protein [Deminuibacter soli]